MTPTLNIVHGETWIREFSMDRQGLPLGDTGWEAEFQLFAQGDPSSRLVNLEVGTGCEWVEPGLLRVALSAYAVRNLDAQLVDFTLVVRDPSTTLDDAGTSWVVARGVIEVFGIGAAGPRAGRTRERIYQGSDGVRTRIFGLGEGTAVSPPAPAPAPPPAPPVGSIVTTAGGTTDLTAEPGVTYLGTVADDATINVSNAGPYTGAEFSIQLANFGNNVLNIQESGLSTVTFAVPAEFRYVLMTFKQIGDGICTMVNRHFVL